MPARTSRPLPSIPRAALQLACALASTAACAQGAGAPPLPPVTISAKANTNPVEKSYRKMVRGMDLFERRHSLALDATLRYKLLPRRRDADMSKVELLVLGTTVAMPVTIAADQTFTLERNPQALDENALVTPDRQAGTMTWRTEIRTPGLPPNTRRLGDLRLECEVGMEAGLVSNSRTFIGRVASMVTDTPAYCGRKNPLYLFFADRPIFSVTLVAGQRREILAIDKLYAAASDDPGLPADLPYCDCEVLLDRTYFLPLGDPNWPDDTRVEFDFMDDAPAHRDAGMSVVQAGSAVVPGKSTRAEVAALLGNATVMHFDSGFEVWLYRIKGNRAAPAATEFVILFAPDGVVRKTRVRPPQRVSGPA